MRDEAKLARQRRHERAFADVLHVMASAGFVAEECLVVLRLNQTTWNDPRLWAPLVNVRYKHTDSDDTELEETRLMRECRQGGGGDRARGEEDGGLAGAALIRAATHRLNGGAISCGQLRA
jgi:hypothetical protein